MSCSGFNVHGKVRDESKEDAERVGKYMITTASQGSA